MKRLLLSITSNHELEAGFLGIKELPLGFVAAMPLELRMFFDDRQVGWECGLNGKRVYVPGAI